MPTELDEYLIQFRREDERLRQPFTPAARSAWRTVRGKSRLYYLMQDVLPPAAFEFALDRGYYGLRRLVGRDPGRGRVLPDFLVTGAAKCGTTSLFEWICKHPFVVRPTTNGRARKELLYFDYNFHRRQDWYRAHFPLERDRREFERACGRRFLTGEATATYLTSYWAPARIAELLPNAKLIVTMRNPIDRAYSAFQMSKREQLEKCETFEAALALEAERLAPEEARVRADARYNPPLPPPLGYWSYLQRSRYAEHVERWLEFFPSGQFLFLKFEDLAAHPQRTLDAVYEFLGLPSHNLEDFPKLNAAEYASMTPETRAHLVDYFRPYNERLRQLTGINFGWDR
jgi:Sulfotransferase domain